MHLPLFIARRYLFSKKKHNAINIISAVSACGIALATLALVVTLSVFNGFQEMVEGFFSAFDPQLKISAREGKVFSPTGATFEQVRRLPQIAVWMETVEENAMVEYKDRQAMATVKGVEEQFRQLTEIDSLLYGNGEFVLNDHIAHYTIPGAGLLSELGAGLHFVDPLQLYAPKQGIRINAANPAAAFNREFLHSTGLVFVVNQQKYDEHYLITSLPFARKLFGYTDEVSAIELKLTPDADEQAVQQQIATLLGNAYVVENRQQQQADVYRIMKVEKLISYLFLSFIIIVACFNVIGSLSMLIIDKRDDVQTLRNLGADNRLVKRIFLFEGGLISLSGAVIGILIGVAICLLQQHFGLISLGTDSHQFVVDAYPVSLQFIDVLLVFITATLIGFISVWLCLQKMKI